MDFIFNKNSKRHLASLALLSTVALMSPDLHAQDAPQEQATKETKAKTIYRPNYWYIGAEFFSPMIYDDLYSWKKNNFNFGTGVQLRGGYMFSSVFGLEFNIGAGQNYMNTSPFQKDFVLGKYDAYTYYPYTLIDGAIYTHYAPGIIGEQGNNPKPVQVEGVPFYRIRSRARFVQTSLNATINLTRLFYSSTYTEKPVELWLKPGIYLSRFRSHVYDTESGVIIAPNVNRSLTWGLGGDLSVRFNLSSHWALDLTNRLIWEQDHSIDGVLNAKKAYDCYVWQPAVGLTYKFRRRTPPVEPTREIIPEPQFMLDLDFWYPDVPALPTAKPRSHSASVYLTYIVNKTFIQPDLHNNPAELSHLRHELSTFTANPDYSIRNIRVEGFASPEGPYDNNMRLAEGRARSIINYIMEHSQIKRNLFGIGQMTENWDGLKDTLTHDTSIPGRDKFLDLMTRVQDTEQLKQDIKRIPEYKWLLENIYPHLRLSRYTVEYDVRSYKGEEAKDIIQHHPESLSAEEIYSVACYYGLETDKADEAIAILNRYYPESDIALTYKGINLLRKKDWEGALSTLSAIKSPDTTVLNALGVAHAYKGNLTEAKQFFTKAINHPDARRNLKQIEQRCTPTAQ